MLMALLENEGVVETVAGMLGDKDLLTLSQCCRGTRFLTWWVRSAFWGWATAEEAAAARGQGMPMLERLTVTEDVDGDGTTALERLIEESHLFPRLKHLDLEETDTMEAGVLGGLTKLTTLRSMVLCKRTPDWPDLRVDAEGYVEDGEKILDESVVAAACALPIEELTFPMVDTYERGEQVLPVIHSTTIRRYDASNVVGGIHLGVHITQSLPGLPALRVLDVSLSRNLQDHGYNEPNFFNMGVLADAVEAGVLRGLEELHIDFRYDEDDDRTIRLLQALGYEPVNHALRVLSANGSEFLNDHTHYDLVFALRGGLRFLRVLRVAAHYEPATVTRALARAFHKGFTEIEMSGHSLTPAVRRELESRVEEGVLTMKV